MRIFYTLIAEFQIGIGLIDVSPSWHVSLGAIHFTHPARINGERISQGPRRLPGRIAMDSHNSAWAEHNAVRRLQTSFSKNAPQTTYGEAASGWALAEHGL